MEARINNCFFTIAIPRKTNIDERTLFEFNVLFKLREGINEKNIIKVARLLNSDDVETRKLAMGIIKNMNRSEQHIMANFIISDHYNLNTYFNN